MSFDYDKAIARLDDVFKHEEWKDGSGAPVTTRAAAAAKGILERMHKIGAEVEPFISPRRDGGVHIEWEKTEGGVKNYLEVDIPPADGPIAAHASVEREMQTFDTEALFRFLDAL